MHYNENLTPPLTLGLVSRWFWYVFYNRNFTILLLTATHHIFWMACRRLLKYFFIANSLMNVLEISRLISVNAFVFSIHTEKFEGVRSGHLAGHFTGYLMSFQRLGKSDPKTVSWKDSHPAGALFNLSKFQY